MWDTTIAVALLLWGLGMITSKTLGGFIHILLVVALVAIVGRTLQGHKLR